MDSQSWKNDSNLIIGDSMPSSYQPGIPTGTVPLDLDYINLQNNFQQLDTSFGVDHLPFSDQSAQNGYHKSIHLNPVSTTVTNPPNNQPVIPPTTTAGYGQVFSSQINDGVNTDQALYYLSGGGRLTQLTRNFQPVRGTNGYTFLPGGLIFQWGRAVPTGGSTSVNFNIPFPNFVYNVQCTIVTSNNSTIRFSILNLPTLTGFVTTHTANPVFPPANNFIDFYWTAIGQ